MSFSNTDGTWATLGLVGALALAGAATSGLGSMAKVFNNNKVEKAWVEFYKAQEGWVPSYNWRGIKKFIEKMESWRAAGDYRGDPKGFSSDVSITMAKIDKGLSKSGTSGNEDFPLWAFHNLEDAVKATGHWPRPVFRKKPRPVYRKK